MSGASISKLVRGVFFTFLCFLIMGCGFFPESTFLLTSDSRLPKWISLPSGVRRSDVSLTMSYYIYPWGGGAKFTLRNSKGQAIKTLLGKVECEESIRLKSVQQENPSEYPSFEAITVNHVTEMIEHRKMEPLFSITDDPAVWKQYMTASCS